MKLMYHARSGERWDLTKLMIAAEWAGDYQKGARSLTVKVPFSTLDKTLPNKPVSSISLGESLLLYDDDGTELFQGYIFTIDRGTDTTRTIKAYDGAIYIMRSEIAANFKKLKAEEITKKVCAGLKVKVGKLASSGGKRLSFPHIGKSAYDAIMAAYTKASDGNKKKYMIRMNGVKLEVIQKGAILSYRELRSDADISDINYTSSIEDAVTLVRAVTSKGKLVKIYQKDADLKKYGRLQKVYRREDKPKTGWQKEAKELLAGPEHTVNVNVVGGDKSLDLITGNAVRVVDVATGLSGIFYIDSDTHTFESGQHSIQLGLRFENRMDEKEADKASK